LNLTISQIVAANFGYNNSRLGYTGLLITMQFCVFKKSINMKIILIGSLGHISKPLTEELVQKGHAVTVISSKPENEQPLKQ